MTKRKTNAEFCNDVRELGGGEYTPLDPYTLSKNKIRMKHNVCGLVYEVTPNNFIKGKRCPKCSRFTSPEEFYNKFNKGDSNPYISMESNFYDYETPIVVYCSLHNYRSVLMPTSMLRGSYLCKYCRGIANKKTQVKTTSTFEQQLYLKHKGSIIALEKYKSTHEKIKFACTVCGSTFKSEPNSVLRVSGCPVCSQSHGENAVSEYLVEYNIRYIPQKTFPECVYKRKLPFDFYLPEYNTLIEFDGKQHREAIDFFGGGVAFKSQKIRDSIKDKFAYNKGINLIRIGSIDEIDKVLNRQLKRK